VRINGEGGSGILATDQFYCQRPFDYRFALKPQPSSMKPRGLLVIRFRNEALEKDIWRVVEEIKGVV
jgi:hypothetical protein